MTMKQRYGRDYPCILDAAIFDELPQGCKDYLEAMDFFLHYDDHDAIILASWDTEEAFDTIDELKAYVEEEVRLAAEDGCWNIEEV